MHEPSLRPLVQTRVRELAGGCLDAPELGEGIGDYIVAPLSATAPAYSAHSNSRASPRPAS
jgi:hypothetical protein